MRTVAVLATVASALAADSRLVEGNATSSVRVVIYEDLQCPDCAAFRKMMDEQLLPRFGKAVAFEHRDFPLAKHSWARRAAIAARFFESISRETGIEFRRWTMLNLRQINPENFSQKIEEFAKGHNIPAAKAVSALDDPGFAAAVERDFQEGVARGIARTPTVLVDGEPFIERFPVEEILKSIERAIAANSK
jgi:protein-disulfide isomerase